MTVIVAAALFYEYAKAMPNTSTNNASTIYALSSAPGRAGVAVIRVSGPAVRQVLARMAAPEVFDRQAAFRRIRHPLTGETVDRAVVLYFAAPRSETGEDVAEFQVHGGRAVISAVLAALGSIEGCRLAEPGEFARRAFLNGKIDLAEVEGLADLVDAETEAQRRQALAQSSGALSKLYEGWRAQLLDAMALAEAAIDFSDEGDVSTAAMATAGSKAAQLRKAIAGHLADGRRGEILREGFRVAILGAPNAGKSSLLNALARRDAAIVSEEAGTTRDVIEVRLDLGGYPVVLSDTAGLREAAGAIEREGIRRSLKAAGQAQLVLWLSETGLDSLPNEISRETVFYVRTKADLESGATAPIQPASYFTRANADTSPPPRGGRPGGGEPVTVPSGITPTPRIISGRAATGSGAGETPGLSHKGGAGSGSLPGNGAGKDSPLTPTLSPRGEGAFSISAKTGEGIDALVQRIAGAAAARLGASDAPVITQARHRQALEIALASLEDFQIGDPADTELRAEDLRRAAHAIARITGRVDVEDVLGAIFGRFCIGK